MLKKEGGGVNFSNEIPLNEISENLKILLKNVAYKTQNIHIPIRIAIVNFAQKSEGGSILQKKSLYKKNLKTCKIRQGEYSVNSDTFIT